MKQQMNIIDGDGHIFEDGEGIARHFPYSEAGGRLRGDVFPTQSHIQFSLTHRPPGSFGIGSDGRFHNPGPKGWIEFMDKIGFDYAVLFPTAGQRIGRIVDPIRGRRGPRIQRLAGRGLSAAGFPLQGHWYFADA